MSYEQIGKLIDQWLNDPAFRKQLRVDPDSAIKNSAIPLTGEERALLKNIDWSLSDEQLKSRISQGA